MQRLSCAAAAVCCLLAVGAPLAAQDAEAEYLQLTLQCLEQFNAGQFPAAEQTLQRLEQLTSGPLRNQPHLRASTKLQSLSVKLGVGRLAEAEQDGREALALFEKLPDYQPLLALTHSKLAGVYLQLGRLVDAERHYVRSYKLAHQLQLPEYPLRALGAVNLGSVYCMQTRYVEGEQWARYGIAALLRHKSAEDPEVQQALGILAQAFIGQGRVAEAEQLRRRAVETVERRLGRGAYGTAEPLMALGMFYLTQHRPEEARACLSRAVSVYEQHAPDTLTCAEAQFFLAALLLLQGGDPAAAKPYFDRSQRTADALLGPDNTFTAMHKLYLAAEGVVGLANQRTLAEDDIPAQLQSLKYLQESLQAEERRSGTNSPQLILQLILQLHWLLSLDEAAAQTPGEAAAQVLAASEPGELQLLSRLDEIVNAHPEHGLVQGQLAGLAVCRARFHAVRGRSEEAREQLQQAMTFASRDAPAAAGLEQDRARALATQVEPFTEMVRFQARLGAHADVEAAYIAAERSKARTLLVQLEMRGVDLLRRLPEREAAPLRQALLDAQSRLRELQLQAAGDDPGSAARLAQTQQAYLNALRDIRNQSPDYRQATQADRQPFDWELLRDRLRTEQALFLEYVATDHHLCLIAFDGHDFAWTEELRFTPQQLDELGLSPRAFPEHLRELLQGAGEQAVLNLLRQPAASEKLTTQLAELYTALLPAPVRERIGSGRYTSLVVVPDGPAAGLPLEALVVERGDEPRYLLDVAPPIVYVPSATVWREVTARDRSSARGTKSPVLTVGAAHYEPLSRAAATELLPPAGPRGQFTARRLTLVDLPMAARESEWVEQVFTKRGIGADRLRGTAATEAGLRREAPGRQIVHVACHALTDQSYGNLFGALALTAGPATDGLANDGFLTLEELYDLNLQSCELAVLSACDTNVGPQQQGEGVFALTRGCLVAGARRVVASNWLVEDAAAAELISYFLSGVAQDAAAARTPDYGARLLAARRWIRSQARWQHPFYWAAFVQVGDR